MKVMMNEHAKCKHKQKAYEDSLLKYAIVLSAHFFPHISKMA